jgi:hypothetical protein
MLIEKYSIGIGDRFGHQGIAQLSALMKLKENGVSSVPVWNKSKREHSLIGSVPQDARAEADAAVKALGWTDAYYVDADHIGLGTVGDFLSVCNFFTLDVADFVGLTPEESDVKNFINAASGFTGELLIEGLSKSFLVTEERLREIAAKYLVAIKEAGAIYKEIAKSKGKGNFVTEVSVDENPEPQTPEELFFILMGLAAEGVPVQTIAPKFSGRFNKGIDYNGDVQKFAVEFEDDVLVAKYAVKTFGLPVNLKLSFHTGSDKFSLYGPINLIIHKHDAGLHLKTAGTTWLEELIGLAKADGEGLVIAKEIYRSTYDRIEEMLKPYLTVVDIDRSQLPSPDEVAKWGAEKFANSLAHDITQKDYNIHFRQLLHTGFKVAGEMGDRYTDALQKFSDVIAANVTYNLYDRHFKRLFL